jgi:peptide/nickel transport system substrate-binding protein
MTGRTTTWGALLLSACLAPAAWAQDAGVTIVLNEEPDLLEPCMATRSNIGRVIMQNVSETLTELDVRGDAGLMPRLAESWEQQEDGNWRFTLRDGVTFSDGTTLDAADVVHSIERAFDASLTCESPRYFGEATVTATAVDDLTVDIAVDPVQPILPLLMSLVTIVPSETPLEFVRDPIGTGPYTVTEWTPGQQVVLTRRDDYWGEAPAVETATYVARPDPAVRAAMVAAGEADIAPSITQVDATDPAMDFPYLDSETVYLRLDATVAPLDDVRVRRAFNMAIDREAFIGTLVPDSALLATAMYAPTTQGWNPDVQPFAYDPEGATALLEEAAAEGVAVDTPIRMIVRSGNFPNVTEVAEALQQMLQDVGFNVELQFYEVAEFETYHNKPYAEGRTPVALMAMHDNSRGDPSFSMFFKYHSEGRQSGISDPAVDDLIDRASAATGDERNALWSELQAYLHDEIAADALLFHMVSFARVGPRVDWQPSIATNSQLQLSEVAFR